LRESLFVYLMSEPQRSAVVHIKKDDPRRGGRRTFRAGRKALALRRDRLPFGELLEWK
jgi:hypothetical protein